MPSPAVPSLSSPRVAWLLAAVMLATIAAYLPALRAPFVFDDIPSIVANPALAPLWPPTADFWSNPAGGVTTTGRPLTALSFALNHAAHGFDVVGYHLVNLAIHLVNGLLLFGLIRQSLPDSGNRPFIALTTTAWWLLHPLATNVVTYTAQRAESLAAGSLLLALYAFARATAPSTTRPRLWHGVVIVALLGGMAAKETAAVGPLLLLLYDRAFRAESWRDVGERRRAWHFAHAACWLLPVAIALTSAGRGDTAGLQGNVSPLAYLATQCLALPHYLRLAVWPFGLVFDHGTALAALDWRVALGAALLTSGLIAGGVLWQRGARRTAFLILAGFLLLAPSSSFIPVATQTAAEHRFYLALALVLIGATTLLARILKSKPRLAVSLTFAVMLTGLTVSRNFDYTSAVALWTDTAKKRPDNPRAWTNLALAQLDAGAADAALSALDRAVALAPDDANIHYNRGVALARLGRPDDALAAYREASERDPANAEAANNLGNLLLAAGRAEEAVAWHRRATTAKPIWPEAWHNLALSELAARHPAPALAAADHAIALRSDVAAFHFTRAGAAHALGDHPTAEQALRVTLRLQPDHVRARQALIQILLASHRPSEAQTEGEILLRLTPDDPQLQQLLRQLRQRTALP